MSRIVTSVCRDSANSPVNIARKYGLHAERITLKQTNKQFYTVINTMLWIMYKHSYQHGNTVREIQLVIIIVSMASDKNT